MSQKKLKERTRAKKEGKKTKHVAPQENDEQRQVEDQASAVVENSVAIAPEPESRTEERQKKAKSKKRKLEDDANALAGQKAEITKQKSKKRKQGSDDTEPTSQDIVAGGPDENQKQEPAVKNEKSARKGAIGSQRFIVFVGNLPFSATTDSIQKHFEALKPSSVRHSTDKQTKKSKGFAFLEFENYDRMKTCLKLYHHSSFNDGAKPARKINVELTAGGGGKSDNRKQKLKEKNEKLGLQRRRRMEQETKRKQKRKEERGDDSDVEGGGEARQKKQAESLENNSGGIHPSRLAQIKA